MILCHARAMASEAIYQTSNPSVTYPKAAADVPNAAAEDWEPVPKVQEEETEDLTNGYDCGCDTVVHVPMSADHTDAAPGVPKIGDPYPTNGEADATD